MRLLYFVMKCWDANSLREKKRITTHLLDIQWDTGDICQKIKTILFSTTVRGHKKFNKIIKTVFYLK